MMMMEVLALSLLLVASSSANGDSYASTSSYNATMKWGTYRPNLYFGTRGRNPQTILTGLAWFGVGNLEEKPWENIRHSCEEGDHLSGYAWAKHDGRQYGKQTIKDPLNNVAIETEFVKLGADGDEDGGDWVVRITGVPIEEEKDAAISLVFYAASNYESDDYGGFTLTEIGKEKVRIDGALPNGTPFAILGRDIGNERPPVEIKAAMPDIERVNINSIRIPGPQTWKMKEIVQASIIKAANEMVKKFGQGNVATPLIFQMKDEGHDDPNVVLFQHTITAPFKLEYAYVNNPDDKDLTSYFNENLSKHLQNGEKTFDDKFDDVFSLEEKGFTARQIQFGKMLIGNMLGGLGYFYGTSIEDHARTGVDEELVMLADESSEEEDDYFQSSSNEVDIPPPNPQSAGPFSLFTGVPSRPFFPRGFLWDSGFDHHLIEAFDSEISLDIISSWANLIDENGWLAREQILGDEARSKVPEEFQVQYPHYANPPTLVTALEKQVDAVELAAATGSLGSAEAEIRFLKNVYPKFKRQYQWFLDTQIGQVEEWDYSYNVKLGFKWRGRKGTHILTSGMDDYPRSAYAHPGDLHIDLISWVSYYARSLERVSSVLGYEDDVKIFHTHQKQMLQTINKVHWDEKSKSFTDVTFNGDGTLSHVNHEGYVSITPLLLGLVPHDSPKLKNLLDLIHDPTRLWSKFGICSLSKSDEFYGQGENYWRGPIWINMNYLLLQSLSRNYLRPGPYQEKAQQIYTELRNNLIGNVYTDHQKSGYVWEQYSCSTGRGSRSHPFTGWTSLILLVMAEKYN